MARQDIKGPKGANRVPVGKKGPIGAYRLHGDPKWVKTGQSAERWPTGRITGAKRGQQAKGGRKSTAASRANRQNDWGQ